MNRLDPRRDLAVRFAFMLLVYAAFALKLPAYYSVAGIASLLDGAFLTVSSPSRRAHHDRRRDGSLRRLDGALAGIVRSSWRRSASFRRSA